MWYNHQINFLIYYNQFNLESRLQQFFSLTYSVFQGFSWFLFVYKYLTWKQIPLIRSLTPSLPYSVFCVMPCYPSHTKNANCLAPTNKYLLKLFVWSCNIQKIIPIKMGRRVCVHSNKNLLTSSSYLLDIPKSSQSGI